MHKVGSRNGPMSDDVTCWSISVKHGTIMADATTVVEGKVKYRDGKKVNIILKPVWK